MQLCLCVCVCVCLCMCVYTLLCCCRCLSRSLPEVEASRALAGSRRIARQRSGVYSLSVSFSLSLSTRSLLFFVRSAGINDIFVRRFFCLLRAAQASSARRCLSLSLFLYTSCCLLSALLSFFAVGFFFCVLESGICACKRTRERDD